MEWIPVSERLPEKGVDVEVLHTDGRISYVFRCSCPVKTCTEWRCSISGSGMIINPTHWRETIN